MLSKNKKILYSFSEENNSIEEDVVSDMWVVNDTKLVRIETEDGIVEIPDNKGSLVHVECRDAV